MPHTREPRLGAYATRGGDLEEGLGRALRLSKIPSRSGDLVCLVGLSLVLLQLGFLYAMYYLLCTPYGILSEYES